MGSATPWLVQLDQSAGLGEPLLGGKAWSILKLKQANLRVANGFCLTTAAYWHFIRANALERIIALELGRKPLDGMRWEELWDTALRIRSAFSNATMPSELVASIKTAHLTLGPAKRLAVRSSAPGEHSVNASFAVGAPEFDIEGVNLSRSKSSDTALK